MGEDREPAVIARVVQDLIARGFPEEAIRLQFRMTPDVVVDIAIIEPTTKSRLAFIEVATGVGFERATLKANSVARRTAEMFPQVPLYFAVLVPPEAFAWMRLILSGKTLLSTQVAPPSYGGLTAHLQGLLDNLRTRKVTSLGWFAFVLAGLLVASFVLDLWFEWASPERLLLLLAAAAFLVLPWVEEIHGYGIRLKLMQNRR
ncbi:MAG TPA: hypothetical protein VGB25_10880 [Candidatus Binatia bacterium]